MDEKVIHTALKKIWNETPEANSKTEILAAWERFHCKLLSSKNKICKECPPFKFFRSQE